jgi:hypothetical protein
MGMDVPNIVRVGIPRSLAALIQRFGQGARAKDKTAVYLYNKYCSTLSRQNHTEKSNIESRPTTRQPLSHREKGLSVTLQRLKTRSQDLYNFLIPSAGQSWSSKTLATTT